MYHSLCAVTCTFCLGPAGALAKAVGEGQPRAYLLLLVATEAAPHFVR